MDHTADPLNVLHTLEQGGMVLLPVDTVPGLAVRADLPHALSTLYEAKNRPSAQALALIFRDHEQLADWLQPSPEQARALLALLPGPLSVVLAGTPRLAACWPSWGESVAVRLSGPCPCSSLLAQLPWPLALSSANLSGEPTPASMSQVPEILRQRVDLCWPGDCPVGRESTVLDLRTDPPRVLREGAMNAADLAKRWGQA
jgi:L-threonylcarbamoyladenylate synthase